MNFCLNELPLDIKKVRLSFGTNDDGEFCLGREPMKAEERQGFSLLGIQMANLDDIPLPDIHLLQKLPKLLK